MGPQLLLITEAFCATAHEMAAAMFVPVVKNDLFSALLAVWLINRTGTVLHVGHRLARPVLLWVKAAMTPATCVPW